MMEEFVFDLMLLIIGIIIGRGYTLDQIEDDNKQHYPYFKRRRKSNDHRSN